MGNRINTINYGFIPIAKKSKYLCDEFIDIIEDNLGRIYEIRKTLSMNALVALEINESEV